MVNKNKRCSVGTSGLSVLRKYSPPRYTTTDTSLNHWSKAGWVTADIYTTFWPYYLNITTEIKTHHIRQSFPILYCPDLLSSCKLLSLHKLSFSFLFLADRSTACYGSRRGWFKFSQFCLHVLHISGLFPVTRLLLFLESFLEVNFSSVAHVHFGFDHGPQLWNLHALI